MSRSIQLSGWILGLFLGGCSGLYSITDAGSGGCTEASQCPQPPNSTAACTNGSCSFVCAPPLLRCRG